MEKSKRLNYFKSTWQLWIMLLPSIIYIFIFAYIPMYGVQLAFREYSFAGGITGGKFVGLKYFLQYFNSPMFLKTIKNTFFIAATGILVGFPAPIILAVILNQVRSRRWQKIVQTTVYIPYFISVVVIVGMMRVMLANQEGILDMLFKGIGLISDKTNLLGSAKAFIPVYVLSGVWQTMGWNCIIYLAALSAVDPQLYDACRIDGAGRFKIIWHIDLPTIAPTMVILLILSMGNILNVGFDKIYLMQNALNKGASEVISTYVYTVGIMSSQFSFGSAVGLFNTAVNFVFLVITNQIAKRTSGSGLF